MEEEDLHASAGAAMSAREGVRTSGTDENKNISAGELRKVVGIKIPKYAS